jgi:hypothetical protein
LTPRQVEQTFEFEDTVRKSFCKEINAIQNEIRDILLLIFRLRFYMPIRALSVIWLLSKSQIHRILTKQLDNIVNNILPSWISLDNWKRSDAPPRYPNHIGIIDCTEVYINNWQKNCFSKKKGRQTVKYQVIINADTMRVKHIYGPYKGSRHDSTLFKNSIIPNWLETNNIFLLGDKGYIGCNRVLHPIKKKKFQKRLPLETRKKNLELSQVRIKVENHFARLKQWKALSYCYRGNLNNHGKVFLVCETLQMIFEFLV